MGWEDAAETAAEQVRRWDAGESIWTVAMGGFGPEYEMCIQVAAVELLRSHLSQTPDVAVGRDWGIETIGKIRDARCAGMTILQVRAARFLGLQFLRSGPRAAIRAALEEGHIAPERIIQCANVPGPNGGHPTPQAAQS